HFSLASWSAAVLRRFPMQIELPRWLSLLAVIIDQTFHNAVGVFAINAWAFSTVNGARSFIIACLNTRKNIVVVHNVWLEIDDRTLIKAGGDQVSRINVTTRAHRGNVLGRVLIRR